MYKQKQKQIQIQQQQQPLTSQQFSLQEQPQLSYHMKRWMKLQKYREKFQNPLGYKQQPKPSVKHNSFNNSTSTIGNSNSGSISNHLMIPLRSMSSRTRKSTTPSRFSSSHNIHHSSCEVLEMEPLSSYRSVSSVSSNGSHRVHYTPPSDSLTRRRRSLSPITAIGSTHSSLLSREHRPKSAGVTTRQRIAEREKRRIQSNSPTSTTPTTDNNTSDNHEQVEHRVDWYCFDMYSTRGGRLAVQDLSAERTFTDNIKLLYELWDDLCIPIDHRQAFIQRYCTESTQHNEASILAEINLLVICRDKLIETIQSLLAIDNVADECKEVRMVIKERQQQSADELEEEEEIQELKEVLATKTILLRQVCDCTVELMFEFNDQYTHVCGGGGIISSSSSSSDVGSSSHSFIYHGIDRLQELLEIRQLNTKK